MQNIRLSPPQIPIIRNIGIKPASKKRKNINKSNEQKTPSIRVSIRSIEIKNSLIRTDTLFEVEIMHIGTIIDVKIINTKLTPSIPTL